MELSTFYEHWNASLSASLTTPKKGCIPCKLGETEAFIGVMSGTSLDGIDVVYTQIELCHCKPEALLGAQERGNLFSEKPLSLSTKHTCVNHFEKEIATHTKQECVKLQTGKPFSLVDTLSLEHDLSTQYRDAIREALDTWGIDANTLTGIGIHGQTVFHQHDDSGQLHTLQLCNPSILAEAFDVPILYDFRRRDIAAGGQGAPLVPFFDVLTLANPAKTVVAHNLGGISNVTVMPRSTPGTRTDASTTPPPSAGGLEMTSVFAFDTGLANMWMDAACLHYFDIPYDKDGELAKQGALIQPLFEAIIAMPFHELSPPKSTGKDLFSNNLLFSLADKYTQDSHTPHDILHTITHATAYTMAHAYAVHILPKVEQVDEIIFSGGGLENIYLLDIFKDYWTQFSPNESLPTLSRPEDYGIPNKAKEALAFAYLGWARFHGLPNVLASCTGANRLVSCGSIAI
jgi:anhydro-N-acetylmuramic acid kinase